MLGGEAAFLQSGLQTVLDLTARLWSDAPILSQRVEV